MIARTHDLANQLQKQGGIMLFLEPLRVEKVALYSKQQFS